MIESGEQLDFGRYNFQVLLALVSSRFLLHGVISDLVLVSEDELLLFKCRQFLLNSPPGVCTVYNLVAVSSTTSPDSSRSVTQTYSWVIKQATLWLHDEHRDSPSAFVLASCL